MLLKNIIEEDFVNYKKPCMFLQHVVVIDEISFELRV